MKNRGFPVAPADDLWCHIRTAVMKVTVIFPSLESKPQCGTLLIATLHLEQLARVLWTAQGASKLKIVIDIQSPLTSTSPSEGHLLWPFLNLRSLKQVVILGASERAYIDELTCAITTTDGIKQALCELVAGLKYLERYMKAEQWGYAIAQAEKHSMLMADYKLVYCLRYIGIDFDFNAVIVRTQAGEEVKVVSAMQRC